MSDLIVVTGPPGSGKSTVAALLAAGSERSVHLHADDFYAWIASGFVDPWLPAAREQNAVVVTMIATVADGTAEAGYDVFLDGVIGPWFLDAFRALDRPVSYVVLRPSLATAEARAAARGDHPLQDLAVVGQMHAAFSELGDLEPHVVDSTALTAEQTATDVRQRLDSGALTLA